MNVNSPAQTVVEEKQRRNVDEESFDIRQVDCKYLIHVVFVQVGEIQSLSNENVLVRIKLHARYRLIQQEALNVAVDVQVREIMKISVSHAVVYGETQISHRCRLAAGRHFAYD